MKLILTTNQGIVLGTMDDVDEKFLHTTSLDLFMQPGLGDALDGN